MMLVGRIEKAEGRWWYAECPIVNAYTQGHSRKDASFMLADCLKTLLGHPVVEVTATEMGPAKLGGYLVRLDSDAPARVAALVLACQRSRNKLSIAEAAKRAASSPSAYARYERGVSRLTLERFGELLAAVAPDLMLTVGPRTSSVFIPRPRKKLAATR
jgi:hypothetical protein